MNKRIVKYISGLLILIGLLLFSLSWFSAKQYEQFESFEFISCDDNVLLAHRDTISISEKFSNLSYLGKFCSYQSLELQIDFIRVNHSDSTVDIDRLIYDALTENLLGIDTSALVGFNPDFLFGCLMWAQKFEVYEELNSENQFIYGAVHSFWLQKISETLRKTLEQDPSLKTKYRFRVLRDLCANEKYYIETPPDNVVKTLIYLLDGKYSYVARKFWFVAPLKIRVAVIVLFIFSLFLLISTLIFWNHKLFK
jgi:hypothetical protein